MNRRALSLLSALAVTACLLGGTAGAQEKPPPSSDPPAKKTEPAVPVGPPRAAQSPTKPPAAMPAKAIPAAGGSRPEKFRRIDGLAASVNGDAITWLEVRKAMGEEVFAALGYRTRAEREAKIEQTAWYTLLRLVREKLLLQRALIAKDINVSSEEVDRAMGRQQKRVGSFWEFMRLASEKGMTLSEIRQNIKEGLLRDKFVQAQFYQTPWGRDLRRYSLTVSPKEIRDYYRRNRARFAVRASVWLRRVVVAAAGHGGPAKAKKLASDVRAALVAGEKPVDVDRRFKLGAPDLSKPADELEPVLKSSGLKQELKDWAFASAAGAVSDVLELAPGLYCVALVEKKRDANTRPFESVQEEIESELRGVKRNRAHEMLIRRLFAEADIKPGSLKRWISAPGRVAPPTLDRAVLVGVFAK